MTTPSKHVIRCANELYGTHFALSDTVLVVQRAIDAATAELREALEGLMALAYCRHIAKVQAALERCEEALNKSK